jgi:hypothetical protein
VIGQGASQQVQQSHWTKIVSPPQSALKATISKSQTCFGMDVSLMMLSSTAKIFNKLNDPISEGMSPDK